MYSICTCIPYMHSTCIPYMYTVHVHVYRTCTVHVYRTCTCTPYVYMCTLITYTESFKGNKNDVKLFFVSYIITAKCIINYDVIMI